MDLVALFVKFGFKANGDFSTENNISRHYRVKIYPDVKVSIYSMLIDNSNTLLIFSLGQKLNSLDTNRW